MKRILALALTVVLVLSMLLVDVGAYAVDIIYKKNPETKKDTEEIDYEKTVEQYLTLEFKTAEDKLETMVMKYEKDGYQLWVDELTGEVATKDLASGQILFSNPYDVGAEYKAGKGPSASTKKKILSQVMIKYDDNGTDKNMYSFEEAAMRGQIKIKNIKNGIRVEYSIGREETRMLVPKVIKKESFETKILEVYAAEVNEISRQAGLLEIDWREYLYPITKRAQAPLVTGNSLWFNFYQLIAYYQLKSEKSCTTDREKLSLFTAYPICKSMDVYVFETTATPTETLKCENYIKTYCPSYTFEQLEIDHAETQYEGSDKNPALFKMSLEYTLDDMGMSVRLPANGLRFNESLYKLNYLNILPYMGAGANYLLGQTDETFTGYNFFPDGSGTIFRHEDLAGTSTTTINAKVYGFDYAYNEITGNHAEVVRYPVFGIVTNYHDRRTTLERQIVSEEMKDPTTGEIIAEAEYEDVEVEYIYNEDRGFAAIIEEGDALAELSTYHEGSLSKYNSINMLFYPRPKDSYNLKNAISVGANATWTVVSSRKYVGNYKIRYIMLTDKNIAEQNDIKDYYEVSWMGMADAYRDYLYRKEELSPLTEADVSEDIPAYIETFGATETLEKILSLPVNVMTPLTSFEDIKTMYDELSAEGVSNIKFKLTGYANGGIFSSAPYKLKWEKAVGGADGFTDLVKYSNEKGFQVFPDFDFAYVRASQDKLFDGLTIKEHVVKSINNTYMSRRYYSATRQTMMGRYELAVSAAYYSHFYEKLNQNLLKYYDDPTKSTISVGTLGNALNSDFDEEEPYNREDSKKSTVKALNAIADSYADVMTESANAYSWKYVDYILNLPLDSSRYTKSGASVPFIGVVLHGSKQFSGSALNMEGNIGYSLLKAIENGAGLYFVLCYQNYSVLKESPVLSEYYSVRYDILKDDVVKYYTLVNDLTKDLQTSKIISHEFLIGERVPDPDEIEADKKAAADAIAAEMEAAKLLAEKEKAASLLNGRVNAASDAAVCLEEVSAYYEQAVGYDQGSVTVDESGRITVTVGMQTLVNRVLELTDKKNGSDEKLQAAETEKNYRAAVLALWTEINNPYSAYMKSGKLSTYANLKTANEKNLNTLQNSRNTLNTRKETLDSNLEKAIDAGLAGLQANLDTYQNATATAEDKAAARQYLIDYAGSLENAEKYVALSKALTAATDKLNKTAIGYVEKAEYSVLYNTKKEADAAYETAKTTYAQRITEEAYVKAEKAYNDAKAALNTRIEAVAYTIENCDKQIADYAEGENEYKLLTELRASAVAELAELKDASKTNTYREEINRAKAVLDAVIPELAATRTAAEDADAKLNAYVEEYTSTYTSTEAYKNTEAAVEKAQADLDAYKAEIRAFAPAVKALDDFLRYSDIKNSTTAEKNEIARSYLTQDEYKKLKSAADEAAAKVAAVQQTLLDNMENDEKYKALKKTYEETKAALEVYTLAYLEKDSYKLLADELEETSSAVLKLLKAYEDNDDYKAIVKEAAVNDAAYEKAYNDVSDIITGKSAAKMTSAQFNALQKAIEAKADTDARLKDYAEKAEAEIITTIDYKKALTARTAAEKAVTAYVKEYLSGLDDAVKEAKDAEKPEETLGGKYSAAQKAASDAEAYFQYFTGEKSVPTTLKNVDVYAELILNTKEYKDAQDKQTAADNALKTYTNTYTGLVTATTDAARATITDPAQKALNDKYVAADNAYKAATTSATDAGTALRAIDSALYSAANSYVSSLTTVITNEDNVAKSEAALTVSSLKAGYDEAMISYGPVLDAFNAATAASEEATAAHVLINADASADAKAQTDAIKNVRTQVTKTNNVLNRINYYVTTVRKDLSDSNFAVETMCSDSGYSDLLKEDLRKSNAVVVELEKQIRELTGKTLSSARNALETANKIYPNDINIVDPYDDTEKPEAGADEGEDEDAKEDYTYTKYTDDSGNIVRIGYENGVVFFLNYNYFDVTAVYGDETISISAYGGIRVNADGSRREFTATLRGE